jgi:hypothetical protein
MVIGSSISISSLALGPMRITRLLVGLGGGIFLLMGFLHAFYTFLDIGRPRRLVPQDPAVAAAMAASQLRLSRGGTTMWKAWVGFNFSHSVGVILFGAACVCTSYALGVMAIPAWILFFLVVFALLYLGLSVVYWFRIPTLGLALATACIFIAWVTYAITDV